MTRLEMTLWAGAMLALFATTAKADHYFTGPPVAEAYALSIELSREAAALSYEAQRVLRDCDDLDDVLDELCDVADELQDVNCAIREAAYKPRKWHRLCKRVEDLAEEICELDEEVREALDDLNRHRPRHTAFVPRGPSHYRSYYRTQPNMVFAVRFGTGSPRFVQHVEQPSFRGVPRSSLYRGAAEGFVQPHVGCELTRRVDRMRAIAAELQRLAHAG